MFSVYCVHKVEKKINIFEGGDSMSQRKRPPYKEFIAWMIVNDVKRQELQDLLGVTSATLSHRLNGTGADFTMEEVRTIINKYGEEVSSFFLN